MTINPIQNSATAAMATAGRVDAVREFNLLIDKYGAEYGKRPGAQVLIVTELAPAAPNSLAMPQN